MRLMGLQAIYPKKNLSQPEEGHRIYPYLLENVPIMYPNQVWSTDITYIRMVRGFLYLCAVIDWYSRYVLSWKLSNSLDVFFCIEALNDALRYGKPEIFNTDQGSQFTSSAFTSILLDNEIRISMDGKGRALDNVFVERLWRSLKYECIFLNEYQDGQALWCSLNQYWNFYNDQRPHQSLAYKTPREVFELRKGLSNFVCQ